MSAQVVAVSCGPYHTAAVTMDGSLFTWGNGLFGKLGHGDSRTVLTPRRVEAFDDHVVTCVSAGWWHTAAVAAPRSRPTAGMYGQSFRASSLRHAQSESSRLIVEEPISAARESGTNTNISNASPSNSASAGDIQGTMHHVASSPFVTSPTLAEKALKDSHNGSSTGTGAGLHERTTTGNNNNNERTMSGSTVNGSISVTAPMPSLAHLVHLNGGADKLVMGSLPSATTEYNLEPADTYVQSESGRCRLGFWLTFHAPFMHTPAPYMHTPVQQKQQKTTSWTCIVCTKLCIATSVALSLTTGTCAELHHAQSSIPVNSVV